MTIINLLMVQVDRCLVRCIAMHACLIGPTDTATSCPGSSHRACVVTMGEYGAGICDTRELADCAGHLLSMQKVKTC